jgi:hypothetical protein
MSRGSASILAATGVISAVTAVSRLGALPVRELAATPQSFADGRVWLLATSAILADRPAAASILGFLVVGLVAVRVCGARVVWLGAAAGHVVSGMVVYLGLGLVRLLHPSAFEHVLRLPDYGSSAVIAAWIGAIAYDLYRRHHAAAAVGLVVVSGLVGWYFKGSLTVIDAEHAFALALGAGAMRFGPALRAPRLGPAAVPRAERA